LCENVNIIRYFKYVQVYRPMEYCHFVLSLVQRSTSTIVAIETQNVMSQQGWKNLDVRKSF